mgnify:FL=1|tara:strand:- start:1966 stop:2676 length:711 start_codon:yes stop_codon:yes gene_type:complete
MIISIEGNIGSGKSTFFNYCRAQMYDRTDIIFVEEPVDVWESIKDSNGISLLQQFYNHPYEYAFCFQMTAYISRLVRLKDAIKRAEEIGATAIITERCVYTDYNVFTKMLHKACKINDIEISCYKMWFDNFMEDIPTPKFIYLKTSAENCYDRVMERNRPSETGISLDYLLECEHYHDDWLLPGLLGNVTVFDGNQSTEYHNTYLNIIKKMIHNPQERSHKRKVDHVEHAFNSITF